MGNPAVFCSHFILLVLIHSELRFALSLEVKNDTDIITEHANYRVSDHTEELVKKLSENEETQTIRSYYGNPDRRNSDSLANLFFNFKLPTMNQTTSSTSNSEIKDAHNSFLQYGKAPVDKQKLPVRIHHEGIFMFKPINEDPTFVSKPLPDISSDMKQADPVLKRRSYVNPNVIFNDPMFGILDRMMRNFIQPVVNPPFLNINEDINPKIAEPLNGRDESSLKFWIQNDNMYRTVPILKEDRRGIKSFFPQDSDEFLATRTPDVTDSLSLDEEYPDYKTDLWKKFMKPSGENNSDSKSSHVSDETNLNDDEKNFQLADNAEQNTEKNTNKDENKPNNEGAWWYRLIFPRRPKILRNHKKSNYGTQDQMKDCTVQRNSEFVPDVTNMNTYEKEMNVDGLNANDVKLGAVVHTKHNKTHTTSLIDEIRAKYEMYDNILQVLIIGCTVTIVLLVLKISVLFYKEYTVSRAIRQYDCRTIPPLSLFQRQNHPTNNYHPSSPPSYSVHIPPPSFVTKSRYLY